MIDLKERGRANAGELWDVALEKGFFNITWSDKVCNKEVLSVSMRRGPHVCQRVWLRQTLLHGDHVPLVTEGIKNTRKETTWKMSSGNAG